MSNSAGDNSRLNIIVLGGCGFIGRHVVELLLSKDDIGQVRVVDKTPPQLAFLNKTHAALYEDPRVEFKSSNLMNPESCRAAFSAPPQGAWSAVIASAGETRVAMATDLIEISSRAIGQNVAECCNEYDLPVVYISDGAMYHEKKPASEDAPPAPWTLEARLSLETEGLLKSGTAPLRILRPGIVYGPGDRTGLTPTLLLGAIYRSLNEPLKLLWSPDLPMNTVHVKDLAKVIYQCIHEITGDQTGPLVATYNVVDEGNSTQGSLAGIVAELFRIKVEYYGNTISSIASKELTSLTEEADDRHMSVWSRLNPGASIEPRVRVGRLSGTPLSLKGSARLERFECPKPDSKLFREVIEYLADLGQFPMELLD